MVEACAHLVKANDKHIARLGALHFVATRGGEDGFVCLRVACVEVELHDAVALRVGAQLRAIKNGHGDVSAVDRVACPPEWRRAVHAAAYIEWYASHLNETQRNFV